MGRLVAIDYGRVRCGVAVTDILHITANALETIPTRHIEDFIVNYCQREPVDKIIVGQPRTVKGEDSESMQYIRPFVGKLNASLPDIPVEMYDERFTSVLAHRAMIDGGMKKNERRNKANVDKIAACIILEDYIESSAFRENRNNSN